MEQLLNIYDTNIMSNACTLIYIHTYILAATDINIWMQSTFRTVAEPLNQHIFNYSFEYSANCLLEISCEFIWHIPTAICFNLIIIYITKLNHLQQNPHKIELLNNLQLPCICCQHYFPLNVGAEYVSDWLIVFLAEFMNAVEVVIIEWYANT